MEQDTLVERGKQGDAAAFAALTTRYREMAFGYALTMLRDVHLAQDVTQEAFFSAYCNLSKLQDPRAFPGWLRGIVHHHCCRVLRRRQLDSVPLDEGLGLPSPVVGPEQWVVDREGFYHVLGALSALPPPQREVAMLFYIRDYSQRDVAAFLNIPLTTVNNRLHAARTRLRERLRLMNARLGTVTAVCGDLVEVQFEPEDTLAILASLVQTPVEDTNSASLEVVQRAADGLVRCLVAAGARVLPGSRIADTGKPSDAVVGAQTLERVISLLGGNEGAIRETVPRVLETGIKVIDLMCPFAAGGKVGVFGPSGCGRQVVSTEILRNSASDKVGVAIFAFPHGAAEGIGWYESSSEIPDQDGAGQLICMPIDDPVDLASPAAIAASRHLDVTIYLSRNIGGGQGIYPAVDPLRSRSRFLDPSVVGQEHYDVARGVRDILRRHEEIAENSLELESGEHRMSEGDRLLIARARKIRRFFSQPFFVAEPFTARPGQYVSRAETIQAFKGLLAGAYDHIPEDAFLWCGSIDQAAERAVKPCQP